MTIGIDITMLVYTGSGVANYTFNLVKNLLKIDRENEYRLFYSSLRRPKNFYYIDELKKSGAKVINMRFPPTLLQLWWGKYSVVPVEWFTGKADIFFLSDFLRPPLMKGTRGITTVHDLTWKLFPEYHEERIIRAHERKLEKTIKYGDEIIVDSQNTKKDLLKLYSQINKNKVHVIYPGISDHFKPINDKEKIQRVLKKYFPNYELLTTNYILYVGAIEPRKNLETAIDVFHQLVTSHYSLVTHFLIVGRAGWKKEKVYQLVKDLKLENKVKFLGFVKDQDLPYFYSAAKLTLYLSSYEGFGLPPLESLACGTPTLAGDNSSMKETLDPKYLVDIGDENKIYEKMKYFLENKTEIDSEAIRKKFDWKQSAKEFLNVVSSL